MHPEPQTRVLVLGLGNLLLGDEGLGICALERLVATYRLPDNVRVLDGGTLGLYLLPYLDGVTDLLIIDSIRADRQPGALIRLAGEAIPAALTLKLSVHQVGLQELLAVSRLQGTLPPHVVLWGMEPARLEPGVGLSPRVADQIDALVRAVAQELRAWGVVLGDA